MQPLKDNPLPENAGLDENKTVTKQLEQIEAELARLTTQSEPKTKKEKEKRKTHKQSLTHSRDNLKAYLTLTPGQSVTDGKQLGVITQLTLSTGGLPEAWVSWYGRVSIPEQPERLKDEPFLKDLRIGDTITLNSKHPKSAGETFEIKEFRGGGWVLTVDDHLFHGDFFTVNSEQLTVNSEPETVDSEPLTANNQQSITVNFPLPCEKDELTDDEQRDRLFLERKVERAFYEAGKALQEIRYRRLYRSTHKTFEQYCLDRFGFGRHAANRLIAGASVVENLVTIGHQNQSEENLVTIDSQILSTSEMVTIGHQNQSEESEEMVTIGTQILPTTERQVRPLTKLEPDEQRQVWQQAVAAAGGKVPSSRIVSDIVQRIREKTRVPNPYRVGDVCTILVKDNPELRGLGGCWCIVTELREFSCLVRVWNGEYAVREGNLKDLGYSPAQKAEAKQISDRLSLLYDPQMEETAKAILASLGKIDRPYLTEFEEKLLQFLGEESVENTV